MLIAPSLTFKIASEPSEFEQIYRLNYKTFVEEIPQHERNDENRLIDRFEKENTYIICLDGERIVGMVAVRDNRPFSLDEKLENLDAYLPEAKAMCEIRLLAVEKQYRNGRVFLGLATHVIDYCMDHGYDMALISGTTREQKLYKRLGFVPFGPEVGTDEARYQPMYLTRARFDEKESMYRRLKALPDQQTDPVSFMPGPVEISESVRNVFSEKPVSHRAKTFIDDFQTVKEQLCTLAGARHVEIFLGTGTLANDVVAAQLSLLDAPGLILANGEFGERLIDHASRFGLRFHEMKYPWGETIDHAEVEEFLRRSPDIAWLWAVHCETSTGILNDIETLKQHCRERGALLCLDCCSSLGTVPLDLDGVYLASSVSGKGLSSYAGLALVFYHHDVEPSSDLPRYLDLGLYAEKKGVPFTHSSNLVYGLKNSLQRFANQEVFTRLAEFHQWLRQELEHHGFTVLGTDGEPAPGIITVALPERCDSLKIGEALDEAGFLLNYRSNYLLDRNWIQISLMGEHSREQCRLMLEKLSGLCAR